MNAGHKILTPAETHEWLGKHSPTETSAWHNDPEMKRAFVENQMGHRALDQLVQGTFGEDSWGTKKARGCHIGCALKKGEAMSSYPELGKPKWLGYLSEKIFEGLPSEDAPGFSVEVLEAVAVGADLTLAFPRFLACLLGHPGRGVIRHAKGDGVAVVQRVIDRMQEWLDSGVKPDASAFLEARVVNALDKADAADDAAARQQHFKWIAEILIEELRRCPGTGVDALPS